MLTESCSLPYHPNSSFLPFFSINKPGGCAKIVKVHTNRAYDNLADDESSFIEGLDVKYILNGGGEKNLDPAIVAPYEMLERGGRSRRGRDFLMKREEDIVDTVTNTKTNSCRRRGRDNVTNEPSGIADANASQSKPTQPIVAAPGKENKNRKQKQKYNSSCRSGATCSSPEPKKVQKRLPKKVTPIPKVIRINTGKEKDDVSPMPMDAMGASYSSSSSSYSTNTKKQRQLDFDEKMPISTSGLPPNDLVAPKRSISTLQSKALSLNNNHTLSHATTTSTKHDKKRKRALLSEGHDKIISSSKTKKQSYGKHSKPRLSSQSHASFSRATSAYSSIQKANCKTTKSTSEIQPTKKKPLLDVYRSEVEKARKFMDEMVGIKDCRNDNANKHDCKSEKAPISSSPAKT